MKERQSQLDQLIKENRELRMRFQEAQETLDSIQSGEIDALVVDGPKGKQLYTLKGADRSYRKLIEKMQEGAVTLAENGRILFANQFMEKILGIPLEKIIGSIFDRFVHATDLNAFQGLFKRGRQGEAPAAEIKLAGSKTVLPAYLSISPISLEGALIFCVAVTDLTEQKLHERILAEEWLNRAIINQATEAIIVCDSKGVVIRASQIVFDMVGGNCLNTHFNDIIHIRIKKAVHGAAEHEPAFEDFKIETVISGDTYHSCEALIERRDVKVGYWLLSAAPLMDDSGKAIGSIVSLNDVTEKKELEERLLSEKQRLKRILDNFPDGIFIVNSDYDIQYINPMLIGSFGSPTGKKCYEYFYERSHACPWCPNDKILRGESVRWESYSQKTKRYYEVFDGPFINEDGSISKLAALHDITQQKCAEIERDRSARILQIRNNISRVFLNAANDEVFLQLLHVLKQETESPFGSISHLDAEGNMVVQSGDHCFGAVYEIEPSVDVHTADSGSESLESFLEQGEQTVGLQYFKPEGAENKQPLDQIVVPIRFRDKLLGMIQLSGRGGGYRQEEV